MASRGRPSNSTTTIVASTAVAIAILASVVALSLAGRDLAVIVGLVTPAAGASVAVIAAFGKLAAKIDRIAGQSNAAAELRLRRIIREEIRAMLTEYGLTPTYRRKRP
jgi:hypothetical protein